MPPLVVFLFLSLCVQANSADFKPVFRLDNFTNSQPVSITTALYDDFEGAYRPGGRMMTWNWAELGLQWREYSLSYIIRYDYDLRFSKDTARLYGLVKNKAELPVGEVFDLELEAHIFHAQGIRTEYRRNLFAKKMQFAIGISYLQADYLVDGHIQGEGTIISENDFDYNLIADYCYTEDPLFDREVGKQIGRGLSLDFETSWQITDKTQATLKVVDLVSLIIWKNLPYTEADATSANKEYDADGYIHIQPTMTGYEGYYSEYRQRLQPRSNLKIQQDFQYFSALLEGAYLYDYFIYAFGGKQQFGPVGYLFKYWPRQRSWTIGINFWEFHFDITADNTVWDDIHNLGFSLCYDIMAID